MKKNLLSTLFACVVLTVSASAGTVKVPTKGTAVASVELPAGWEFIPPDAAYKDFDTFSTPDRRFFAEIKAVSGDKGGKAILDDTEKWLKDNVSSDLARTKQSTFKVANVEASELHYKGDSDGGDTSFVIVVVPLKDKTILLVSWDDKKNEKALSAMIRKMADSLKAL